MEDHGAPVAVAVGVLVGVLVGVGDGCVFVYPGFGYIQPQVAAPSLTRP
jgi:hypothetical protein